MKIKSTIPGFPTAFCRRMVAWCCKELELPVREVHEAMFRRTKTRQWSGKQVRYGGLCRGRRIGVRIGDDESLFPCAGSYGGGVHKEQFADRTEALVSVTAHELAHVGNMVRGCTNRKGFARSRNRGGSERYTIAQEMRTLRAFRLARAELLADWNRPEPVRASKPKPSAIEQRAQRAAKQLAAWQRKAKLAATKLKKYRRQVAYYEKKLGLAAKGANP